MTTETFQFGKLPPMTLAELKAWYKHYKRMYYQAYDQEHVALHGRAWSDVDGLIERIDALLGDEEVWKAKMAEREKEREAKRFQAALALLPIIPWLLENASDAGQVEEFLDENHSARYRGTRKHGEDHQRRYFCNRYEAAKRTIQYAMNTVREEKAEIPTLDPRTQPMKLIDSLKTLSMREAQYAREQKFLDDNAQRYQEEKALLESQRKGQRRITSKSV